MIAFDKLLSELGRRRGETTAAELAQALGVSQPTISRLLAAAQPRVCRIGRGRAARYAMSRTVPGLDSPVPIRQIDERGGVGSFGFLHPLAHERNWLERPHLRTKKEKIYDGLPPFAADMSPQGYMGPTFSAMYPELGLPMRLHDWNDDHRLIALARRGEDCPGNLIIGDESFDRFLAQRPNSIARETYPEMARRSLEEQPGSSAGGEQPKFACYSEGRHVLVKFTGGNPGPVTQRWMDLLVCERLALETLRAAGILAAAAQSFDMGGLRFLEIERFDRVGLRGRKATISLLGVAAEYLGHVDGWTRAALDLAADQRVSPGDAGTLRRLDAFGQLIGNSDRHFGNITFFVEQKFRLAPVYDMLPMIFAPQGANLVERRFTPLPPSARNFDVWHDAARLAVAYWERLAQSSELSDGFRLLCRECERSVRELAAGSARAAISAEEETGMTGI